MSAPAGGRRRRMARPRNLSSSRTETRTLRWRLRIMGMELVAAILVAGAARAVRAGRAVRAAGLTGGAPVVCLDNSLDQAVTHNVAFIEIDERDALDIADHFDGFDQAGAALIRQVNLRDVAGDDRFGIEAQASEKHLHLFACGVLGFVQDDERIVE